MFEINTDYNEYFDYLLENQMAYRGGEYDFTFENRYLIYHVEQRNRIEYIAVDLKTHQSSMVSSEPLGSIYVKETYFQLVPKILKSIKYTGDIRYLGEMENLDKNPYNVIDTIFHDILPQYGYTVREEQITLCKEMLKGFEEKQVSICEAEVGTGKSMAYLVAALVANQYYKAKYDVQYPVAIVTSSIELQKALVEREIPKLSSMLLSRHIINRPLTVALRKGREHYFCVKRFEDFMSSLLKYPMKYWKTIEFLKSIESLPHGVDLDNYNINNNIIGKICVKGVCGNCHRKHACEYYKMNQRYEKDSTLDFQVANHNLFLMSEKHRYDDIPPLMRASNFVVIDEAHKFKEAAQDVLGETLSKDIIQKYVNEIKHLCASVTRKANYNKLLDELCKSSDWLFDYLQRNVNAIADDSELKTIIDMDINIEAELNRMIYLIGRIHLLKVKHRGEVSTKALLASLSNIRKHTDNIMWLERDVNGSLTLKTTPKNIGSMLLKTVWRKGRKFVLTSGTMSDGEDFTYFKADNGLERISKKQMLEVKIESPYDYEAKTRLYIPEDMPEPDNNNIAYIGAIASRCLELINISNGHTAILFTSYKVLNAVYELLKDKLENYKVFIMTRGNKSAITEYKKSQNGVIFASGSMWEGIDCAGDILSNLIIVRLPFPLRTIIMEERKQECSDIPSFIERYCTPSMLIKLRQGVGRLIRNETDSGIVSILDSRVASGGRYRERVLKTLAKYPLIDNKNEIHNFLKGHKPESYWENNIKEN